MINNGKCIFKVKKKDRNLEIESLWQKKIQQREIIIHKKKQKKYLKRNLEFSKERQKNCGENIKQKENAGENKIVYDNKAIDELRKIHYYIKYKLREDKIAKRLFKKIKEKLNILEEFPFLGKLITKTKNFEYRKFIIKNYIIIYKINLKEKEINILHIYNQKQKIKNKKEYSQV